MGVLRRRDEDPGTHRGVTAWGRREEVAVHTQDRGLGDQPCDTSLSDSSLQDWGVNACPGPCKEAASENTTGRWQRPGSGPALGPEADAVPSLRGPPGQPTRSSAGRTPAHQSTDSTCCTSEPFHRREVVYWSPRARLPFFQTRHTKKPLKPPGPWEANACAHAPAGFSNDVATSMGPDLPYNSS